MTDAHYLLKRPQKLTIKHIHPSISALAMSSVSGLHYSKSMARILSAVRQTPAVRPTARLFHHTEAASSFDNPNTIEGRCERAADIQMKPKTGGAEKLNISTVDTIGQSGDCLAYGKRFGGRFLSTVEILTTHGHGVYRFGGTLCRG